MAIDYRDRFDEAPESKSDNGVGPLLRIALVFVAASLTAAVLAMPLMQRVAESYSRVGPSGIDRILTGGTPQTTRYTIRKSVLNPYTEKICGVGTQRLCDE